MAAHFRRFLEAHGQGGSTADGFNRISDVESTFVVALVNIFITLIAVLTFFQEELCLHIQCEEQEQEHGQTGTTTYLASSLNVELARFEPRLFIFDCERLFVWSKTSSVDSDLRFRPLAPGVPTLCPGEDIVVRSSSLTLIPPTGPDESILPIIACDDTPTHSQFEDTDTAANGNMRACLP